MIFTASHYGIGRHLITIKPHDAVQSGKVYYNRSTIKLHAKSRAVDGSQSVFVHNVHDVHQIVHPGIFDSNLHHAKPHFRRLHMDPHNLSKPLGRWSLFCLWIPMSTNLTILELDATDYAGTILSTVHDLAVWILPQPVIWRLQMSLSRKASVSIIFAIGFLYVALGEKTFDLLRSRR